MTAAQMPQRVRAGHVAWVAERLSERDWKILETVNALHLVTGWQLDRLIFDDLAGRSRTVTRSLVLSRLNNWRVIHRLPRRIGGAMRGSSVAVYSLGSAGQKVLLQHANSVEKAPLVRKSSVPSERFVAHIVAGSELYVGLAEAARTGRLVLRQFTTEPAAWWPNAHGGWLKPDAFVVISNGLVDQLWWIEVDRATESLPAISRKLKTYLDFVNRGGLGPRDAIPRVLVTVPTEERRAAISAVIGRLPPPASELCHAQVHDAAVTWLSGLLQPNDHQNSPIE